MTGGRLDRVKRALRRGVVCSIADLYGDFLANGRNDVSDLRKKGWDIEATWEQHGKTMAHKHYRLIKEPKPEQLAIV